MKRSAFDSINPIIAFIFFFFALIVPMLIMHPVLMGISFAIASTWSIMLGGRKSVGFILKFVLPIMLLAALLNPLFNHKGMTVLFYLRYNPITLESVYYGMTSGAMLGTVLLWFSCFNIIMTSDKIIYLCGRIVPSLSLIITMVFRFVPLFKEQLKRITLAVQGSGQGVSEGSLLKRAKSALRILSALITWSLENAVITSDSMRARGYGLHGRTSFSIYKFDRRDAVVGGLLALGIAVFGALSSIGAVGVRFFPRFALTYADAPIAALCIASYALTLMIPVILSVKEAVLWRCLKSKI